MTPTESGRDSSTPMSLLSTIQSPEDLKRLRRDQLPELAQEIRDRLIECCSITGGHIGASLGVVELSIALLYEFDSPADKIVWDVGHQAYAWKLLTGRNHVFPTLRQEGGISGFLKRAESEHDQFGAGHAGTAMSAGHRLCCPSSLTRTRYRASASSNGLDTATSIPFRTIQLAHGDPGRPRHGGRLADQSAPADLPGTSPQLPIRFSDNSGEEGKCGDVSPPVDREGSGKAQG